MRLFILLLVIFITTPSFAQIGEATVREEATLVGKAGKSKLSYPQLEYINSELGRFYILTYHNAEYTNIVDMKSVGFIATEEEIEYVYQFLKEGFGNEEDRSLKVGKDELSTSKTYSKKSMYVFVRHHDEPTGFFIITTKKLDMLFGKAE